ncbi:MAG: hypothetical protein K5873_01775 [Treponema sp.]|nr:hypothetical protein [Treponema sp.]
MGKNELTGIERKLVLDYLMDGNPSLWLIPIEEDLNSSPGNKELSKYLIQKENVRVKGEVIFFENLPGQKWIHDEEKVMVQFYFNRLGLYFLSKIQLSSSAFSLTIPSTIYKIEDKIENERNPFSATLYYEAAGIEGKSLSRKTEVNCIFDPRFPLFQKNDRTEVMNRYLLENAPEESESISGRMHPPSIIYIDGQSLVFAARKADMTMITGARYSLLLTFPLSGPVKSRKVSLSFIIEEMFESYGRERLCALGKISSIQEEDLRFITDKFSSSGL